VFHFSRKVASRADIRVFLNDYQMQSLTPADFEWAYQFGDVYGFEDALQVALAIRSVFKRTDLLKRVIVVWYFLG
jgi:hypothetical protein